MGSNRTEYLNMLCIKLFLTKVLEIQIEKNKKVSTILLRFNTQ